MYLDVDCKYNSIRHLLAGEQNEHKIKNEITSIISGFIEDFQEEYFPSMESWQVHILDSSDNVKYSFHFAVDIKIKNFNESEAFHRKFLTFVKDNYEGVEDYMNLDRYIDKCVYTKNRLIRLPNQSKFGQNRPLKIFSGSRSC